MHDTKQTINTKESDVMDYIKINGQKIKLTEKQVQEIRQSFGFSDKKLIDVPIGGTFKIGEDEFIVLNHLAEGTMVISKKLLCKSIKFGRDNNYDGSFVDDACNEFADKIMDIVGEDNLFECAVDLTSDDGLEDYGVIRRRMAPLTTTLYREYVEILDMHKIEAWQWLATPCSTPKHGDSSCVKCVSPSGGLVNDFYNFGRGVRPFCVLNSSIFVSE